MSLKRALLAATMIVSAMGATAAKADYSYTLIPSASAFTLSGGASVGSGGSLVFGAYGTAFLNFGSALVGQALTFSYSGYGSAPGLLYGNLNYAGNSTPLFAMGTMPTSVSVLTASSSASSGVTITGSGYTLTSLTISSPSAIQGAPLPALAGIPAMAAFGLIAAYSVRRRSSANQA